MSRSEKKAGKRLNGQKISKADLCDVTLNDFANSSGTCTSGRLKKNSILVNKVVKKVKNLNLVIDDETWEKKLQRLEMSNDNKSDKVAPTKKSSSCIKEKENEPITNDLISGYCYPFEIWFLISKFITPENVGKFAGICKATLAVTSTAEFWFNLYKRYYRNVPNMPEQLQPKCMVRPYSLRAHVIRALYYTYPPFVEKLKSQLICDGDPHLLKKYMCISCWYEKIKNHWVFSFKLKNVGSNRYPFENVEAGKELNLLELLGDITANHDQDCKILQVACVNYTNLQMLSGQILSGVCMQVSSGMNRTLQLNFGSSPFPVQGSISVIFDQVVKIQILDWWHPKYPHSYGINTSLVSEEPHDYEFDELEF